ALLTAGGRQPTAPPLSHIGCPATTSATASAASAKARLAAPSRSSRDRVSGDSGAAELTSEETRTTLAEHSRTAAHSVSSSAGEPLSQSSSGSTSRISCGSAAVSSRANSAGPAPGTGVTCRGCPTTNDRAYADRPDSTPPSTSTARQPVVSMLVTLGARSYDQLRAPDVRRRHGLELAVRGCGRADGLRPQR